MSNKLRSQAPQWMVVYVTHNVPEAHIVAGRLESEGIPAMVHQVPGASALGIHIGSLGEITVLVREADYSRAMMILDPDTPDLLTDSSDDMIYLETDEDDDE
jgi:hypothetical protein